jgi:hypothetical protein
MAISTNGESWQEVENTGFPAEGWIRGITFGGGRFVAVGVSATVSNGHIAYSTDGVNWTAVEDSKFGTTLIESVAWGNNRFVAVGWQGKIAHSPDGIDWTIIEGSPFSLNPTVSHPIHSIGFGNNRFIVSARGGIGGHKAYSTDGIHWYRSYADDLSQNYSTPNPANSIIFGNGLFVAGSFGTAKLDGSGLMVYSSNGINWELGTVAPNITSIRDIAYNGSRFVAVGGLLNYFLGRMVYSDDGINWSPVTNIPTYSWFGLEQPIEYITGIAHANGRFVAVAQCGNIIHSNNGTSWTLVTNKPW